MEHNSFYEILKDNIEDLQRKLCKIGYMIL